MPPLIAAKRTRLLMSADAVGGVWSYALTLSRELTRQGFEIELAVLGPSPSPAQVQDAQQIAGLHLADTGLALDWTAAGESDLDGTADALRARASAFGADIVHLNAPAHAGREPWPVPLVVAAHSCVATWWRAQQAAPLPPDLVWRKQRTAIGLSLAGAIIAPSGSFAREIADTYGAGPPIVAVHNAVAAEQAAADGPRDLIATAGRLWDAAKNVATLDEAAAASGLVIQAAGPTRGPNGQHIDLAHLQLAGTLDRSGMQSLLARTSIFVSPARYEPFGLGVLEAAHAGAALVLSDIPTFRELWSGAARFVRADDPDALAAALLALRRDDHDRRILAGQAMHRARLFSPRRMLAGTLRAYAQALRSAKPRQTAEVAA